MTDCTCSNCIFIDNGMRYCYDCGEYSKMPTREEIERRIIELGNQMREKAEKSNEHTGRINRPI